MTTLTEFLLARIAEDEAVARNVKDGPPQRFAAVGYFGLGQFDPDRVLAEVEAKRQIVAMVPVMEAVSAGGIDNFPATKELLAYPLRALAGIYADHPDYDETWRA